MAIKSDQERELDAAVRVAEVYSKQFQQNRNRLEAVTARHWPELTEILDLGSATLLELLAAYGGPVAVARNADQARELMRQVGGSMLGAEKVQRVLASARSTIGQPQIDEERRLVQMLAVEARRNQKEARQAIKRIEELTDKPPVPSTSCGPSLAGRPRRSWWPSPATRGTTSPPLRS